jgi:hypothetical protein
MALILEGEEEGRTREHDEGRRRHFKREKSIQNGRGH